MDIELDTMDEKLSRRAQHSAIHPVEASSLGELLRLKKSARQKSKQQGNEEVTERHTDVAKQLC